MNSATIWSLLSQAAASRGADAPERAYDYDRAVPLEATEEALPDPQHRLSRLCFRKADGHRFAGLLIRPRAEGRHPVALLLHALSSDKEAMIRLFGRPLAERGVAALALDAHLHGERKADTSEQLGPLEYLELARESVVEYRQAMDYLRERADLDDARIGLLGYSLGAMMGCILAGVDERVRASVFMVGGDMVRAYEQRLPAPLRTLLEPVSPSRFAAHISPRPVFFINGRRDTTVPHAAAAHLHAAAREPKEILWADAGHVLPPEVAARGVEWLIEKLLPSPQA